MSSCILLFQKIFVDGDDINLVSINKHTVVYQQRVRRKNIRVLSRLCQKTPRFYSVRSTGNIYSLWFYYMNEKRSNDFFKGISKVLFSVIKQENICSLWFYYMNEKRSNDNYFNFLRISKVTFCCVKKNWETMQLRFKVYGWPHWFYCLRTWCDPRNPIVLCRQSRRSQAVFLLSPTR